jgi:hypothetical protein
MLRRPSLLIERRLLVQVEQRIQTGDRRTQIALSHVF